MAGMAKVTRAQIAVLEILFAGFAVSAEQCPNKEFWKAECEHLPRVSITTLNKLALLDLVEFHEWESGFRSYKLTWKGRERVKSFAAAATPLHGESDISGDRAEVAQEKEIK